MKRTFSAVFVECDSSSMRSRGTPIEAATSANTSASERVHMPLVSVPR